ncbi:Alpha 1,4-glycosyltransferase domain containing protein [Trema orientale]|uniref:Alpha 1,4-glycosyltransferase domain containing protein n=1 Tax=Trema orientale TaxID=63057 RepID=A0A2P5AJM5_TREOI|nr:Alpha 1,4-glycosyltransferase domain containing protein [Trema orientale]
MTNKPLRSRRRPRYGAYACAVGSAVLLLLSVSLLYSRLSLSHPHHSLLLHRSRNDNDNNNNVVSLSNPLISDVVSENDDPAEDRIDERDDEEPSPRDDDSDEDDDSRPEKNRPRDSGYFYDHVSGVIRRAFRRRSIEDWDDESLGFGLGLGTEDQSSKAAFGSDDVPVDETVRRKASEVASVEDALLLKVGGSRVSPLREGWGDWFDKKSDFLRRDRMFKSNLESLNPLNNPILQDPDGLGVTTLTRGDRLVQKLILNEFKRVPFLMKKPLGVVSGASLKSGVDEIGSRRVVKSRNEVSGSEAKRSNVVDGDSNGVRRNSEFSSHIYADGKRWGYYPGLQPYLSFSDFMDEFFKVGKCEMRVFMVWNSPPWMFSVRYQRGLESLLYHHRHACVVVLSETIELDFFKGSFLKDGYKVAVAMPNLDELLKDTPTHVFTSAWFEWRKTKYYSTHYSELVRLAVLYKYGGIYLDSDIVVLKPLSTLSNSVGMENSFKESSLNGAVMVFRRHSRFLMECMKEFYMTYDDTRLRWNGADLLTRVATKFLKGERNSIQELELKVHHSQILFPISSENITRYFTAPATETEKSEQDALFKKILNDSLTFHFWNSLTSALIPEPDSLVTRLIEHNCIRCSDVL